MEIIRFAVGDTLILKKKHPCGATNAVVLRVGSEVRMRCTGCGHDMAISRIKLEKHIKKVVSAVDTVSEEQK